MPALELSEVIFSTICSTQSKNIFLMNEEQTEFLQCLKKIHHECLVL